jgi:hypothetical protein
MHECFHGSTLLLVTKHCDTARSKQARAAARSSTNGIHTLLPQGAPWSVRLAAKLLRERGRGPASPWHWYLRVLPQLVPAPLETFSWEEMQEIEYQPALDVLYKYQWLVQDSYQSCSREAVGGATAEEFQWAMSVSLGGGWDGGFTGGATWGCRSHGVWLCGQHRCLGSSARVLRYHWAAAVMLAHAISSLNMSNQVCLEGCCSVLCRAVLCDAAARELHLAATVCVRR